MCNNIKEELLSLTVIIVPQNDKTTIIKKCITQDLVVTAQLKKQNGKNDSIFSGNLQWIKGKKIDQFLNFLLFTFLIFTI